MVADAFIHLAETLVPVIVDVVFKLFVELLKYMQAKKESKATQEKKTGKAAKRERKREAAAKQEREKEIQQEAREREAQQQERERETTQQEAREREAKKEEQERKRNAKERLQEQEREAQQEALEKEIQQKAREREAKKDEKSRAKLELEQKIDAKLKHINDTLQAERRDRMEGERNQTRKIESLTQSLEYTIKLVQYLLQSRHPSSSNHQTLEYQERVKIFAHFQLPEDSDEDLQNMFRASYLKNPRHPLHTAESSKDPNGAKNIEDELLRLAMTTTTKGQKNAQDITILDLHSQLFDDFEESYEDDDIASSVMAQVNNVAAYGNRAMAHIKLNKFIEAEQDCTDALKIDDRYFKAYERRAIARTKLGCNFEGALEDVEVALKLEPNNLEMKELYSEIMSLKAAAEARERGNKLFKDKKFEEAIICYTVSINISPTAVAYSNKAMAYLKLNKLMEAENDCTDALKIDNQCFKAYARRANARSKLGGNLKGALEDVEAALNLEPNNQDMKELHAKLINQMLG